jgi:hypothetical protein
MSISVALDPDPTKKIRIRNTVHYLQTLQRIPIVIIKINIS